MSPKKKLYDVDLEKLEGEGDFPCPRCSTRISPDDESDEIYEIVETRIENGELEKLVIVCKNCLSRIDIAGFISDTPAKRKAKRAHAKKGYEKLRPLYKEKGELEKGYEKLRPLYKRLTEEVRFILIERLRQTSVLVHSILPRVKKFESFYEKIIRKKIRGDPFEAIDDFAAVRIICLYRRDLATIGDLIAKNFKILQLDTLRTRPEKHFGYMSDHYTIRLLRKYTGVRYDQIKHLKCEIQVRTILMHAWASVSHHLDYKKDTDIPENLRKDFAALSGLFYVADTHFEMFRRSIHQAESKLMKSFKKKEFDLNQEMNLVSLRIYLRWKFPNRRGDADSFLLNQLMKAGVTKFAELEIMLNKGRPTLEQVELKSRKDSQLTRAGVIRFLLATQNGKNKKDKDNL